MTLESLMIHTCSLQLRKVKQQLAFTQGTVEIIPGPIQGALSGAQATVEAVLVSTGTWAGGDAAGSLILSQVQEAFQAGEELQAGAGRALAGAQADHELDTGEKALYWTAGPSLQCRFAHNPKRAATTNLGEYTQAPVKVYLPSSFMDSFTTEANVKITTTSQGFAGTYLVLGVHPASNQVGLHHVEADLQRVPYAS
jgi:hypothetical protein